MTLLQKLADNKPVDTNQMFNEPGITILRKTKVGSREKNQLEDRCLETKEFVRTLVEGIPEKILMQTTISKKTVIQRGS